MDAGQVCIPNIGVKNRRQRRNFGIIAIGTGVIIGLVLVVSDLPEWTRMVLLIPFFGGTLGIFQAREKT